MIEIVVFNLLGNQPVFGSTNFDKFQPKFVSGPKSVPLEKRQFVLGSLVASKALYKDFLGALFKFKRDIV